MTRITLAVAANKSESRFPEDLEKVTAGFGGQLPASPYDGSPVVYAVFDGGKSFSISVPEARTEDTTLPEVTFSSVPPALATK